MTKLQKEVLSLSDDERVVMLHLIQDSLDQEGTFDDLTEEERQMEEASYAEYNQNPASAITMEEFFKKAGL